jgi:hypothetical protein
VAASSRAGVSSLFPAWLGLVVKLRTYQSEGACRAARDARVSAAQRAQPDVAYRCLPADTTP